MCGLGFRGVFRDAVPGLERIRQVLAPSRPIAGACAMIETSRNGEVLGGSPPLGDHRADAIARWGVACVAGASKELECSDVFVFVLAVVVVERRPVTARQILFGTARLLALLRGLS